jgi:hypothetical protein
MALVHESNTVRQQVRTRPGRFVAGRNGERITDVDAAQERLLNLAKAMNCFPRRSGPDWLDDGVRIGAATNYVRNF